MIDRESQREGEMEGERETEGERERQTTDSERESGSRERQAEIQIVRLSDREADIKAFYKDVIQESGKSISGRIINLESKI